MLEGFNCWMHVSIDSVFKKTYEMIRRGASYEQVMENCEYYLQLMEQRGFPFTFRFCPMRLNWQEIPDTVQFCNEKGIDLMFNQVDSPVNLSLATLPPSELQTVVAYLEKNAPTAETTETEKRNLTHYRELLIRLEGFLKPHNRLQGLIARLDTSAAVVSQYSKGGKEKASIRVSVPVLEESRDLLTHAAKNYVITRLNMDQARQSELEVPDELADRLVQSRVQLVAESKGTEQKNFITVFLNELIRTYSGVWGVVEVHEDDVFVKVGTIASSLVAGSKSESVIEQLLDAPMGGMYQTLSTRPAEEAVRLILNQDWNDVVLERVELESAFRVPAESPSNGAPLGSGDPNGKHISNPEADSGNGSQRGNGRVVVRRSGNEGRIPESLRKLSYRFREGDTVPIEGGFSLRLDISGPASLVRQIRSDNVLLSIHEIHIHGSGQRKVLSSTAGEGRNIEMAFDQVRVEGVRDAEPFVFDFVNGITPPDVTTDPFKMLCWGFSMGGRHYSLAPNGQYLLTKDDEDAQMEAMSRIIDGPVWLPDEPVEAGAEWSHVWIGACKHRENDGHLHFQQTARFQHPENGGGAVSTRISAKTTGNLEVPGSNVGGQEMSFEADTSVTLDTDGATLIATASAGTITTSFPSAGFLINWQLESRYETS